ncbi:MAG TPA: tautomerase family protein [Polyangia bacterium]
MPVVQISTRIGLTSAQKRALLDAVHEALMAAFKIPDTDRTQRLSEFAPDAFDIPAGKGPRYTLVEIAAFPGRSRDAKRALYREIVTRFEAVGVPADDVFIVLSEHPLENWGLRGGQAACDLEYAKATLP